MVDAQTTRVLTMGANRHPVLRTIAWTAAILASAPVNLRAQQAAPPSPYDVPLLDRSTLTGNWGGARDDLAARGITISPSVTQFYQGPTAGNADDVFVYGGKAEALLNIDFAKLGLWNGFGMQVHGEYNFGKTPGATVGGTTIPNNTAMTFPWQNQPGGDLTSVFFSQRLGSNFTLTAGKHNMFDFYAAGHQFSGGRGIEGFWNTAFVGPPSGIVPVAMFGAIGSYKIKPLTFTLMVYDPTDALNRTGLEDPFSAGVDVRGSVDLASNLLGLPRTDSVMAAISSEKGTDFTTIPNLGKFADTPSFRNALITAFIVRAIFGENVQNILPPLIPPPTEKGGRYWLGYSFEQTLWQSPTDSNTAWGLFGQTAVTDGNPNSYKWSAMGGIGGTGLVPGRPNDRFGVGAFYYGYSNDLKEGLAPLVTLRNEYGAELFYNLAITKWFRVTADLQVIAPGIKAQVVAPSLINPTVVNNSTVVLLGLRGQVVF
jgi:porin